MWTSFHPRRFSTANDNDDEGHEERPGKLAEHASPLPPIKRAGSPSHRGKETLLKAESDDGTAATTEARRQYGLWPLQIASGAADRQSCQHTSMEQESASRGSESSVSGSSNLFTTYSRFNDAGHDVRNNPSPPSPFEVHNSDSSPPMTPPDALSSVSSHYPNPPFASLSPQGAGRSEILESHMRRTSIAESKQDSQDSTPQQAFESTFSKLEVPKSSSRNSIFTASSPVMMPAPRLPSVIDQVVKPPQDTLSTSSNASDSAKQAGFWIGSSTSSIAPSPINPLAAAQRRISTATIADDHDRPGYGRSNTEERERERERIRQTNMEVEFRLFPTKEFLLGEGRHSDVYLGSYRVKRKTMASRQSDDLSGMHSERTHKWTLCAMKRPHADHQSQLLALEEAFALRRLGPHPNIIKLIKIRDEVELSSPPPSNDESSSSVPPSIGKGLPSDFVSGASSSVHSRSTSDAPTIERGSRHGERISLTPALHRRLVSQPEGPMNNSTDSAQDFVGDEKSTTSGAASEPPRLIMLLELLPYSLSTFVRRNAEVIDFEQWRFWALELASVVEWMHARGCIHADLKPENVLLTADLRVKICDFNSAVFPNPSLPLIDGMGLGTPAFGAPELSQSNLQRGSKAKGFGFPVDIWSLGAILYSLATGVEPFRRARSMIDMVYRKRVFFTSEENDRIARMSVAEGSSTAGVQSRLSFAPSNSSPASRSGSLRGRKNELPAASSPPTTRHHRAPSTESVSSVASSTILSSAAGRHPSAQTISLLLDDETPTGLLMAPGSPLQPVRSMMNSSANSPAKKNVRLSNVHASINGHHRASSMGKMQTSQLQNYNTHHENLSEQPARQKDDENERQQSFPTKTKLQVTAVRPDAIRRTISYTGQPPEVLGHNRGVDRQQAEETDENVRLHDGVTESSHSAANTRDLRVALAAAIANSAEAKEEKRSKTHDLDHVKSATSTDTDLPAAYEDVRPYSDGSPALILPGGGRLPDEARSLLERMLNVDPDVRPTAAQVRDTLLSL